MKLKYAISIIASSLLLYGCDNNYYDCNQQNCNNNIPYFSYFFMPYIYPMYAPYSSFSFYNSYPSYYHYHVYTPYHAVVITSPNYYSNSYRSSRSVTRGGFGESAHSFGGFGE